MKKIFLSHGHNEVIKLKIEKFIRERLRMEPVVLSEEPSRIGKTIIEALETFSEGCAFAFILLTADDVTSKGKLRGRQNVIHECGYFQGKLGRDNVVLIMEKNVELPSNLQGLYYLDYEKDIKEIYPDLESMIERKNGYRDSRKVILSPRRKTRGAEELKIQTKEELVKLEEGKKILRKERMKLQKVKRGIESNLLGEEVVEFIEKNLLKNVKNRVQAQEYFRTANDKFYKGKTKEAISLYSKAIKIFPNYSDAYLQRGWGFSDLKQHAKAIVNYSKVIKLNPLSFYGYYYRGNAYFELKQYRKAIEDYNKAILLDPKYRFIFYSRAMAYEKLELRNQAIEDYNKFIELAPEYSFAYYDRARVYEELEQYEKAVGDYTRILKLEPNDSYAYYNRGQMYNALGWHKKAIADYSKAIKLNPKDSDAYYARGWTYGVLRQYRKAIADCSKAIKLNPKDSDAYYDRGYTYDELGQYKKAIADYSKAIKLNPKDSDAYYARGYTYDELGQYKKAIADYSKVIKTNSKDPSVYFMRGLTYYEIGQHQRAIKDYNKTLRLTPRTYDDHVSRAGAFILFAKYEKAKKEYNTAVKIDPKNPFAYIGLSEVNVITGHYTGALSAAEKAVSLALAVEDKALSFYLECVARRLLNRDTSTCGSKLNRLLQKGFALLWSFEAIEHWLKESKIEDRDKQFIIKKTNAMKKHRPKSMD